MFKYSKKLHIPYSEGIDEKRILKTTWAFIKKHYSYYSYKKHTVFFELGMMSFSFNKGASGQVSVKQKQDCFELTMSMSNFMLPGFLALAYFFMALTTLVSKSAGLKDLLVISIMFLFLLIIVWLFFFISSRLRISAIKNELENKFLLKL